MSRVKKATHALKRRRNVLRAAKGFRFGRSTKERQAKEALRHAGAHAFAHRRDKKNDFRRLWNIKINAAARLHGTTYRELIHVLKKNNVALDRKSLAHLGQHHPDIFQKLVADVKKS